MSEYHESISLFIKYLFKKLQFYLNFIIYYLFSQPKNPLFSKYIDYSIDIFLQNIPTLRSSDLSKNFNLGILWALEQ